MQRKRTVTLLALFAELCPFDMFHIKLGPLYNFRTVNAIFMKLNININLNQQCVEDKNCNSTYKQKYLVQHNVSSELRTMPL